MGIYKGSHSQMKSLLKLNKTGLCSLSCLNSCAFGLLFYSFGFFAKHSKLLCEPISFCCLCFKSQCCSAFFVSRFSFMSHLLHISTSFWSFRELLSSLCLLYFHHHQHLDSRGTVLLSTISAMPCSFIGVKSPNSFLLRFNKLNSFFQIINP